MLVLTNIQVVTAVNTTNAFKDVTDKNVWYFEPVQKLASLRITEGNKGMFMPNNTISRAEYITFICRVLNLPQTSGSSYTDIKKHWAEGYITSAQANDIVNKGDKTFRPNAAITRAEAVEMLCRALKVQPDQKMQTPYADVTTNSGYINAAYLEYLMQGSINSKDNKRYFYPNSTLKRCEAATVIVNMYDYKASPDQYKAAKKLKDESVESEAEIYNTWLETIKKLAPELLGNTDGLIRGSVYESYKYLKTETDYLKVWGTQYGMNEDEFTKEMVRVGTKYAEIIANANYKGIDNYEKSIKVLLDKNTLNNYLQKKLSYVKDNTIVSQGSFSTSTGMLVFADWGNPVLRGTMKYKYSSPTSSKILSSETVASTGESSKLDTWYEQDFEISFLPEKDGLKVTRLSAISDIRIVK